MSPLEDTPENREWLERQFTKASDPLLRTFVDMTDPDLVSPKNNGSQQLVAGTEDLAPRV